MKYIVLILAVALSTGCNSQAKQKFNLDFESYNSNEKFPKGWIKWGNYDLGIDSISNSGEFSGKIISDKNGSSFGSIAYKVPANYKGDSIQLEGYMKIQDVENGFAGLLMRIDGNGSSLVFDNMKNQNITGTKDWKKYSIKLPYPEEAENIFVAGIIVGKGKAWFDDFVLTIDGKNIQTLKEIKKPIIKANLDKEFDKGSMIEFPGLNEDLITNLELLGRIWGFLKYHHPEVAKGNYNWDYELFRILPKYIEANSILERDQILIKWIEKYGKVTECKKCKETSLDALLKPDLFWVNNNNLESELKKKLNDIYQNRHQGKHFYIGTMKYVGNPKFLNENSYSNMSFPDEGFRLLTLYRYWNMINYFFPYKHLMDKDWNKTLKEYIPKFINAKNELEFELASIQIIGDIKDTHGNIWGGGDKISQQRGVFHAPVHLRFIQDKLVVTDYYNPELKDVVELEIGDIITHVNERKVETIIDSLKKYYPASNNAARMRDICPDILRSNNGQVNIRYITDGRKKRKDLTLYKRDSLNIYRWYKRDNEKCYKMLEGNIGYITLKSIEKKDIKKIKKSFKDTKGIIIDIRNYPSTFVPFLLGSYFVSSSTPFVKFSTVNVNNPGEFTFTKQLEIPKPSETYQGKLIVIVNELSQSQAEYTAMAFRAGDNTTIIGSTTAGADGNVSAILLPGGLRTMISGIGVYYPDGSETQRAGIVPDIEVNPTIEGIKNGKDELLERAIELINE
ncbi:MAG: S41 family peptidase [Bacteroidota bacterium]